MKLILGGYGVMGRVVEGLALERGHEIVGIFSLQDSENSPYPVYKDIRDLPRADAIIDFSHPKNTSELLRGASHHKTPYELWGPCIYKGLEVFDASIIRRV